METLHSTCGYVALLGVAWVLGTRRTPISYRPVVVGTLLQVGLAATLLLTQLREHVFNLVSNLTDVLQATALKANESLLFIGIANPQFRQTYGPMLALEIAAILIFVASLSRILYHYRILPGLIIVASRVMQRLMGISGAESVGVVANVFLGMTEAPLLVRPFVSRMTESELFCLMCAGMATIAGTVMVVYASMLSAVEPLIAGHLFTASLISAPAAIAIAKLMMPETDRPLTAGLHRIEIEADDTDNGVDAAARGATEGINLFINIIAVLIAFIGLVALANVIVSWIDELFHAGVTTGWSLQAALGRALRYPVWLMGIPWHETEAVGRLMGIKTILNEFVAFAELTRLMGDPAQAISQRSFLICTYALCGFANFGSVAIMIGGIGAIAPERRGDLARLGLRSLAAGTLATMLTGCIIGLFA